MRKEVIWAIFAGIVLGLVVAYGVYRINSTLSANKKTAITEQTPTAAPKGPSEFKIVIDKPQANDVVTVDSVSVSGLTKPNAWVTVSGEEGDYIVQADGSGSFNQDVSLVSGINQLKTTVFDTSGAQSSANVLVVYSSSFRERTSSANSTSMSSSDSSGIRQKVAQDLANTINRPKSYIGTVTDITDSTIEIKTKNGEIEQVSINPDDTSVVNSVGTTTKTVKTTDIAIGDNVVVMGYIETNSVLGAQRILVINPITEPKVNVNIAKVIKIAKKALTVSVLPDNTDFSVEPSTSTVLKSYTDGKVSPVKIAAFEVDDLLIYISSVNEKNVTSLRSIFKLPKP